MNQSTGLYHTAHRPFCCRQISELSCHQMVDELLLDCCFFIWPTILPRIDPKRFQQNDDSFFAFDSSLSFFCVFSRKQASERFSTSQNEFQFLFAEREFQKLSDVKSGPFFSDCFSTKDGKVNIKQSNLVAPFSSFAHGGKTRTFLALNLWKICKVFFRLSLEKSAMFFFHFSSQTQKNKWQLEICGK